MEKRHDEMGIPRYKQRSVVGDYSSVELTKTIIHASPFKVYRLFLMFWMGPVTHYHLCCSLGLLGNIPNNVKCSAVLLSLKCFAYIFWRSVYIPPVQAADRILPGFLGSISHSFMWCRASAALSVATQHWYRYTCNCCKLQHLHMRAPEETVLF